MTNLSILNPIDSGIVISLVIMGVLIILSALMSGSEVAYFSISKADQEKLKTENSVSGLRVLKLLETPKKLLATILIANNFINVAIVAVSTIVMNKWLHDDISGTASFVIQVVLVTFIILLFGEVMPKVYATKHNIALAKFISSSLSVIKVVVSPISSLLVASSSLIDKRIKKKTEAISVDHLEHALSITKDVGDREDEKKILEGIIKFGNTDAKQIMTPRMDIISFDVGMNFNELKEAIVNSKYSRIPVFEESIDSIKGILYVKDLLPYIDEDEYKWQTIIRSTKFIPENKKLDDLLTDFQNTKTHMAVVVDEYGGTSGIVTLEDVLEEIVGDITDEFDDEDLVYTKIDNLNFVFEGKTPIIDMCRVLGINGDKFEDEKGEADTIAGFCIEQAGKILLKNEKVVFEDVTFTIEAADRRRIKQVKVTLLEENVIEGN